jgi:predicted GNAT family acetyltransferase
MSETDSPEIIVHDDAEHDRYVVEVDGKVAGYTVYHIRGGRYFFVHTEIKLGFGGQGVGSMLARHALDDVREKGGMIIPICPFIRAFVDEHPEYESLVDHELWDRIHSRLHSDG